MDQAKQWYRELRRPSFAPPAWVFGPVWAVLYLIIAVSFGYVAYRAFQGTIPYGVLGLFVCNLIFNLAYSPIQFRMRDLVLGSVDVTLVWATLALALAAAYPYAHWVALINIPYLLWTSFASILQLTITVMNRDKWMAY